jgi:hypothetical protein
VCSTDSVLKRILGPKRDEATKGWRNLHNEELRDLCSSPSVIRITKLRRMRWEVCSRNGAEVEHV